MPARETAWPAGDRGHSLVEVMVSIVILCVAIIPMVSMFDVGLSLATSSGHYDGARLFANGQLELAAAMPYEAVRDAFPTGAAGVGGAPSPRLPVPASAGLPEGATYSVTKRFVEVSSDASGTGRAAMTETSSAGSLLRVEVVVSWEDHAYAVSGVYAGDGL